MVDVVAAESGTQEFLKEVRLFVGALCRAEAGERPLAVRISDPAQFGRREIERLFPGSLAEDFERIRRIHREIGALRDPGFANERLGQTLGMRNVIEAVSTLDTKAALIGRSVASLDEENAVVLDVIRELASHAAIRTDGIDLVVGDLHAHIARGHERPGGTRLYALATTDACRCTHRIVEVEHDLCMTAAKRIADNVVDLLLAASTNATCTLNASIEIDSNAVMRDIARGLIARPESRGADAHALQPRIEFGIEAIRAVRHVARQQFEHHLLRGAGAITVGLNFHALGRLAATRSR